MLLFIAVVYVIMLIITTGLSFGIIYEYFSHKSKNPIIVASKCLACGFCWPLIWGWLAFLSISAWLHYRTPYGKRILAEREELKENINLIVENFDEK